jgi:APA family basic amino acid/polyamine antiporter
VTAASVEALSRVELEPSSDLPRRLGFWPTTAIVVGITIGSGIFRVPATVATAVGSPAAIALVWILGGVISLCGALALAELGAAMPASGGVFVYLREAYGPLLAFLFGWTELFLGPASLGAISLVFAEYLGSLLSLSPGQVRLVAMAALLIVGAAGYRSVRGLGGLVSATAATKLAALATLVLATFLLGDGRTGSLGLGAPAGGSGHWGGIGLALVAALWAYNGFQDMVNVAGEVRHPGRTLPRALMAGTLAVIVIYLGANAAYLYALPYEALKGSPLVASDTMIRVVGPWGAAGVAAMVMISTFGTLAGLSLATPRIFFAMARAGLLFQPLARVHPRFGTPHVATTFAIAVAVPFVWSRTFEQLTEAFILGIWPFLALAAVGVLVLRRTRPNLSRPYHTPGYPVTPLIFVAGTLWVMGSALIAHPITTLAGIGLTLFGVPVYYVWRKRQFSR